MSPQATDEVSYNTIQYTYDSRGNILSKTYLLTETVDNTEVATEVGSVTYRYNSSTWYDRLVAYDGITITNDAIGNPTAWHDGATMTWQHGRQLASHTKNGVTSTYAYDDEGVRTSKTVNGVTTNYSVVDGTLRRMSDGTNTLQIVYGNGLYSVICNGTEYWYVFNAQGDVIGLIDASGEYVVEYVYDSWGKPLSKTGSLADTLGTINPFRYRGYIYDEETGFYYCQTRYYAPEVGRFLNSDSEALVTATPESASWDKNLYAYCDNNPIVRADDGGEFWHIVAGAVVGGLISGVMDMYSQVVENGGFENINWTKVLVSTVAGAVSGGLAATGVGLAGQIAGNAIISMANNATNQIIENKGFNDFDIGSVAIDGVIGGIGGALGGPGAGTTALDDAAKLMNKNAVRAVRNQTKNGIKGAISRYANSAPVKKYYKQFAKDSVKSFFISFGETYSSYTTHMFYSYAKDYRYGYWRI